MKTAASLILVATLAACGGPDSFSTAEADLSAPPSPFALQFSGTYLGGAALDRIELHRDGTYRRSREGDARSEHGRFIAGNGKALPLSITLRGSTAPRAEVTAYDGALHVGGETLKLQRPAQADETLCDSSGGQWTDDDPDPRTGLYCVCPGEEVFIPAASGCVL